MIYGRDGLRRFREQQAKVKPEREASPLPQVPADAPMDDATFTVWNGKRFVAWETWLSTAPLIKDDPPQVKQGHGIEKQKRRAGASPQEETSNQRGLW